MTEVSKNAKSCVNQTILKSLRKIMQDDYPEVLQSFLDESLSQYTELHEAFVVEDYERLQLISGFFKDSCSSVGAEYLSSMAEKIGQCCHSGHYQQIEHLIAEIDGSYEDVRSAVQKEQQSYSKCTS